MPAGAKPGERRGGRKKGVPNHNTHELRTIILVALEEEGGVKYMRWAARNQPAAFLSLLGRVLPTTLTTDGPPIRHVFEWLKSPEDEAPLVDVTPEPKQLEVVSQVLVCRLSQGCRYTGCEANARCLALPTDVKREQKAG